MDIQTARGVAARIWCDPEYDHIVMDAELAERIAQMLLDHASSGSLYAVTPDAAATGSATVLPLR